MKDRSSAIGLHIEPLYGIEPFRYHAALPISRQVEALTWDAIDRTVSEPYYDIRDAITEHAEQQALYGQSSLDTLPMHTPHADPIQ